MTTGGEVTVAGRGNLAPSVAIWPLALWGLLGPGSHGPCRADGPAAFEVRENFAGETFDRARWSVDRRSPPGVRVDLGGESLRIAVPGGPAGRPPAALRALFSIEGDFELRADYALEALPRPAQEWSNVEIFIDGPDGAAAVIRTNHATLGDGYTLWCEPAPGRGPGAWKHVPTGDRAGTLRLERVGHELRFWAAAPGHEPRQLGTAPFGDRPVRRIEFRAITPRLRVPLAFRLDDIIARADRLIEPPRPADLMYGRSPWVIAAFAAFLALVALATAGLRARRIV